MSPTQQTAFKLHHAMPMRVQEILKSSISGSVRCSTFCNVGNQAKSPVRLDRLTQGQVTRMIKECVDPTPDRLGDCYGFDGFSSTCDETRLSKPGKLSTSTEWIRLGTPRNELLSDW